MRYAEHTQMTVRCPRCDGLGRTTLNAVNCTTCGGSGEVALPDVAREWLDGRRCDGFSSTGQGGR